MRPAGLLARAGVNKGGQLLLVIGTIDAVGTGLYLAGSALFFTTIVGLSTAQVGIGLSAAGLLGMIAQTPMGWVADRYGPRAVLIALNIWRCAGFVAYAFVHDVVGFVVVAALLGIAEQASLPVYQALVEQVVGTEHRTAMSARLRVAYNVGFTVGALLCTVALGIGTRDAFLTIILGDAATFLVAAALLPTVRTSRPPGAVRMGGVLRLRALRDRWYVAVAGINAVLLLHMTLLIIAVPLWITTRTGAPTALVGILLVVNTVLAILFQVRAARTSDTVTGAGAAQRRAGLSLAACCLLLAAAPLVGMPAVVGVLVLGVVALTVGELWQSAGGWGLSYALAPAEGRGEYLATFHLSTSAQYVVGPLLVTVGVVNQGAAGWIGLAAAFVLAGMLMPAAARRAAQRPQLRDGALNR